jgi:hypothetical protein
MRKISILILFLFFLGLYFFSGVGLQNSGDSPQYRLTQSIVDHHSYSLDSNDELIWPDIIYQNDKVYSGRSPGESFLAIPFYLVSKIADKYHLLSLPYNGQREGIIAESSLEASTAMFNAFYGALGVIMVFGISFLLFSDFNSSYLIAVLYGLGTLNWKYSSMFCRHSPHVFFLLLSIFLLFKLFRNKNSLFNYILLSFSLALSVFTDPTSIIFSFFCIIFALISISSKKLDLFKTVNHLFIFGLIIFLINIPTFFYNQTIFEDTFSSVWSKQVRNTWLSNRSVAFSTPFISSFVTNFFSPNRPIKPNVFSLYILNNPQIAEEQGLHYASTYQYKGIFFQSPYLFLIFLSFFLMKNKKIWLLIFTLAIISCIMQFLYLVFYSPNSYDTRFFLPAAATLSLLVTPFFVFLFQKPVKTKIFLSLLILPIILISFFQSWVSSTENFAPHLTGEKRVIVSELLSNLQVSRLFIETFPNIYNYKIFFIYSIIFTVPCLTYFIFPQKLFCKHQPFS